jgi:hypothetical protein
VRIVSNGTAAGTYVYTPEGERLKASITEIVIRGGKVVTATLVVRKPLMEVTAEANLVHAPKP